MEGRLPPLGAAPSGLSNPPQVRAQALERVLFEGVIPFTFYKVHGEPIKVSMPVTHVREIRILRINSDRTNVPWSITNLIAAPVHPFIKSGDPLTSHLRASSLGNVQTSQSPIAQSIDEYEVGGVLPQLVSQ